VVRHDSDYYRMGRQQLVLKALREQLNPCALVPNIPNVLSAIQGTLWTNLDLNDAPEMAALATRISTANIATYPLTPLAGFGNNIYPEIGDTSVLQKYQTRVKTGLNGVPSAFPSGGGGGGGGFHC
jgi:anionic cell wall polymer biosynthesis LytR-Cps2A-Psr (LCP) family protein